MLYESPHPEHAFSRCGGDGASGPGPPPLVPGEAPSLFGRSAAAPSPFSSDMGVAEIGIRGYTVGRATAHLCGPPFFSPTVPRHFAEDVIEQIDAAEAAGAAALFVPIDSLGGESGPGLDIFDRLRRFSQERGPVVTYVREAGSSGVFLALAGDLVLMDPAGRFVEHSCWGDQLTRDTWNEYLALLVESRSLTPYWRARSFMVESPPTGERHNVVIVDPAFALELGWCDLLMGLEHARTFVQQVPRTGIPVGLPRQKALAKRKPLAVRRPTLSTAAVVDVVKLTDSQKDRDNLWFNPSSEIDPPAGADTTQGEWVDRYQAGAPPASYSGSWVRQKSDGVPSGFWLPCSPGAMFYAEAQVKRTSGTNTGGRLAIEFYPTLGTRTGVLASAYSPLVTSASWTLTQVTSAAAPAGTNAVFIGYACPTADTCYFDALYARRVMQAETIASEVLAVTWGTGWTTTPITYLRRSAGLVVGDMGVTAAASAAWTSIFTLPVGARPLSNVHVLGLVFDGSLYYVGRFLIDTAGVCQLVSYDNGTSVVAPFAIAVGNWIQLNFAFPWI